jgi:DHA1 family tetracycline resistance protein-like MFS transporter
VRAPGRAALAFIAVTVCLDTLSQSIVFPILPRLVEQLLNGDRPATAQWVGFLEVAWVIPQFFAAPLLGMLSDRFGRRPVILVSVFGVGVEMVMGALAPTVGWLLLARVLCGLTCGGQAAAMAYVADVTEPRVRARSYGWLNAAMWTGVILGPALGGVLATVGLRAPFWAAAAFALANGVYGCFVLPESLPKAARAPLRWSKANPWGALGLVLQRRGLAALCLALLLLWFAHYANQSVIVLYTAYRYGWSPLAFGTFCSAAAVVNIAVQGGLAGRVAQRIGERRAVVAGLALQVVGFIAMGLAPTSALFWAANLPIALGNIAGPSLQSMMTAKVAPDEHGRLQGAIGSISGLTGLIGPIGFTQVFAWSIAAGRGPGWSGATMLLGAGLSLAAWSVVAGLARERPTPPAPARPQSPTPAASVPATGPVRGVGGSRPPS